jgi:ketosteroid isomerase-like protein
MCKPGSERIICLRLENAGVAGRRSMFAATVRLPLGIAATREGVAMAAQTMTPTRGTMLDGEKIQCRRGEQTIDACPIDRNRRSSGGGRQLSRRLALGHLGAALAAGTGLFVSTARAQNATPASSADVPPLLQQMVDAINAVDSAALAALYIEDGSHEDIPAGVTVSGREEIAAFVNAALGQFRDVRFAPVVAHQAGDLAVLEYELAVTDPESGQPLTYRGVLVLELDGAMIRRSADYYDVASILGQLGLLPEAALEGTPAP